MPDSAPDHDIKEAIELQVVPYTFGHGPGRPLFLTARRFIVICKQIEQGASTTEACRKALVSYAGFRNHVTRNPKYQKRLKKAEACRDQVWRSDALEAVRGAFTKNWQAAMTFLERRYPNEFALRNVNRADSSVEQPVGNEIPAERLAEYGRLMLEFAEEAKAKELAQQDNEQLKSAK
jgi:hypothetical protein